MPGITNPAEEYFKDGLWGWVTDEWEKLIATVGGALHIQIAGQEAEVEVIQIDPASMKVGAYGWDGSVWHKLPLVWGYSDVYGEYEEANDVTADDHELTFSVVPDGEVWILTNMTAWSDQNNTTSLTFTAFVGGVNVTLLTVTYPTAPLTVYWSGFIVLKKDDYIFIKFRDCALNDDIRANAAGYKMLVAA